MSDLKFEDLKKPQYLALIVAAVVGGFVIPMFRAEAEISVRDYVYLKDRLTQGSVCPGLAAEVKNAGADGRITQHELKSINYNTAPCELAKAKSTITMITTSSPTSTSAASN